jgi:chemotaxis protein MotB
MSKEDSLNSLGRSLADREAKLAELQAELEAKDKAMKGLKDRVSKALTGFEGKGLTVEQRGGKIYVSLENKLLFPSGSIVVDQQGRDALVKLAKAIENEKDLNILVEGHTDTDKVLPGSTYKDNWDLSVLRATSVVRILQEGSKLDPKLVTAGGRGEYVPVDPADKSRNRRIEVILAPDLTELYKLVKD